jgi:hypothetical protein
MKTPEMAKNVIHVTSFDLSVMEVVETIAAEQGIHKKIILRDLGINHTAWAKMLKNERNVSTKSDRQAEIISILKGKYDVDPDYIRHYPNHTAMFLRALMAEDNGGRYKVKAHGSIRSLQKAIRDCEKLINKLLDEADHYKATITELKEDLANARLLISELRKAAKK